MAWGAAFGAVLSLAQSDMSDGASGASGEAAREAGNLQRYQYNTTRRDQAPYRGVGLNALARLGLGMGMSEQELAQAYEPSHEGDETEGQIRARLSPQFMEGISVFSQSQRKDAMASLDTAVAAELERVNSLRQAQMAMKSVAQPATSAGGAPGGDLMRNFSMADYEADPGYAFRQSEGQKALERSAAARGGLYSGRAAKDLSRFSQDQASQEYGNAYNRFTTNQTNQYNRLANLAGIGQTANNALSTAGSNYANQAGNYAMINGANQGNASLASGAARISTYQGLGNALGKVNWNSSSTNNSNQFAGGSDQWTGGSDYAWD